MVNPYLVDEHRFVNQRRAFPMKLLTSARVIIFS
jgi:hypothetical protein